MKHKITNREWKRARDRVDERFKRIQNGELPWKVRKSMNEDLTKTQIALAIMFGGSLGILLGVMISMLKDLL